MPTTKRNYLIIHSQMHGARETFSFKIYSINSGFTLLFPIFITKTRQKRLFYIENESN